MGHLCAVRQLDASFDLSARIEVSLSVLRAYEILHGCDVVHGDVNLKNVLITADGTVRLVDFGLARVDTAYEQWWLAGV
jgi:serine/threonine protein kinase